MSWLDCDQHLFISLPFTACGSCHSRGSYLGCLRGQWQLLLKLGVAGLLNELGWGGCRARLLNKLLLSVQNGLLWCVIWFIDNISQSEDRSGAEIFVVVEGPLSKWRTVSRQSLSDILPKLQERVYYFGAALPRVPNQLFLLAEFLVRFSRCFLHSRELTSDLVM